MKTFRFTLMAAALLSSVTCVLASPQEKKLVIPDFTSGDAIPAEAKHDWNLGPTGLRGWMFCDKLVTTDARQILITKVEPGSPADGRIAVGDVILGIDGQRFSFDPRTEFGRAITNAETEVAGGNLVLTIWRNGQENTVTINLSVLGSFSATAPYDCPKSRLILQRGLQALAAQMDRSDYANQTNPIPRALNALALLAGGDPSHLPLVDREAKWAANFKSNDFKTWYYGYVMIFLAEYTMTTGESSVLPGLQRLALEAASGQSAVGSWGHTFARPDGRLKGYGMMNSPGLALTLGMVLAREAGVNDARVDRAIELSTKLLRFYKGKGAIPYGDHDPWTETHEDNGKCGMAAVLFNLLAEEKCADFFTRMAVASHGPERDGGHTGNYFNMLWSMPAVAQAGSEATGLWMKEFGAWYHDLARRWDGTFAHQGPPEPDYDSYQGWDATGPYLLAYATPLKKIMLTGKTPGVVQSFSRDTAQRLIADGCGWNNKDRNSFYDGLSDPELLERLGSWSPIVRERAAEALARRKEPPIALIIELLESENPDARVGACHALEALRGRAAPAVPQLRLALHDENLWLRIRAATALAMIGEPAMSALPDMLEIIARSPSAEDPRGMEQRFVSMAIFNKMLGRGKLLRGVNRDQLRSAIVQGLQNQDGRARSDISTIFQHLSFEDIQPLLPAILEAVEQPAPSGEMFADGVRLNGLKVLAQHRIEEGIQAAADYLRTQNPWASQLRTPEILQTLDHYGAAAQRIIPHLRETAAIFAAGEVDFPKRLSEQKAKDIRQAIEKIESAREQPELIRLK